MTQTPSNSSDSEPLSQLDHEKSQASLDALEPLDSPEPEPQEKATATTRNRWFGILLTVLALGGGITIWQLVKGSESEPVLSQAQTPPPRPVTVTRLQTGNPVQQLRLIGQVEASEQATIRSQLDGTVQQVLVKVGDRVTPGTTVAIMDDTDQQLALREAEARLAQEKSRLAELQAGTRAEILSQRQAQFRFAQAREQETRDFLQKTEELAPKLVAQRQAELKAAQAREQEARNNLQPAQELAPKQIAQRKAELQSATAREQEAQDNLERISSLVEAGVQSQRILIEAQSAVDGAIADRLALESAVTATENETQQDLIAAQANIDTALGERLEAEAALASIETENQRNIAGARTAVDAAIEERLRVEAELAEAEAGPRPEEIAAQQGVVKAAEAAVNQARVNLERTDIKSPTSGVVQSRTVNGSDYVESSDPILTLVSDAQLDVFLEVPEAVSGQVMTGIPVELAARALPGWQQVSRIAAVVPAADSRSRRQLVRVSLDNPPEGLLPGMAIQGTLELLMDQVEEASYSVPRDALVRRGNQWLLFAVSEGSDNIVQQVEVRLLSDLGSEMVVANADLQEWQSIILKGGDGLQDGASIKIVEQLDPSVVN
ncbi:MAG: efflux RND transporter periplasmic adaptor subunit [Microcoleaceae cyanobacterium]